MNTIHVIRALTFFFGVIAVGGSIDALARGLGRGMTWSQTCRFLSLIVLLLTVMVGQYAKRDYPLTNYTWAFFVGTLIGALGVWSELRRPIRPPR